MSIDAPYFNKDNPSIERRLEHVLLESYFDEYSGDFLAISFGQTSPALPASDLLHSVYRSGLGIDDVLQAFPEELQPLQTMKI